MKIKTLKEAIDDIDKINRPQTIKAYLSFCMLRIENGNESYFPSVQEIMDTMNRQHINGMNSILSKLIDLKLIPKNKLYSSSTSLFDANGEEIKQKERGIYAIKCTHGCYIGLSTNLNIRLRTHMKQIKEGLHSYISIEDDPKIYILEKDSKMNRQDLRERERYHANRALKHGINVLNKENFHGG